MDFKKEREYIGDINQLFAVREYRLTGGRSDGVRAVEICTGSGLEVTLLPDRAMDIYQVKYNGRNLNYLTKSGVVSPFHYDRSETGWLRSFAGGFLTTCGMRNIGVPCKDEYEESVLHGTLGNIPAEHVNISRSLEGGVPMVEIVGTMNDSQLFGYCLTLTRTYRFEYGSNAFSFTDRVENVGCRRSPLMLLYHFNMGYPLLSTDSEIIIPTKKVMPRTKHAADYADEYLKITPPGDDYEEMCYYHDLESAPDGTATVGVKNRAQDLSAFISFNPKELDHFVQWKMLGKGEYVTGLEPGNATIDGRPDAMENGSLKFIDPGEEKTYTLKVSVGGY